MPISPVMPTSFVPRTQQMPSQRPNAQNTGSNIFLIVAIAIFAVALLASGVVFGYDRILTSKLTAKEDALAAAQNAANKSQVQNFIRLRDRLTSAQKLLNSHVTLSGFFDTLESLTPQNVKYNTLSILVAGDNTAQVEITGVAKNFNTLASQSNALSTNKHIKHAIFSGINLNKDTGGIGFTLKAMIDSTLVVGGTSTAAIAPINSGAIPTVSLPTSAPIIPPTSTTTPAKTPTPTMPTTSIIPPPSFPNPTGPPNPIIPPTTGTSSGSNVVKP